RPSCAASLRLDVTGIRQPSAAATSLPLLCQPRNPPLTAPQGRYGAQACQKDGKRMARPLRKVASFVPAAPLPPPPTTTDHRRIEEMRFGAPCHPRRLASLPPTRFARSTPPRSNSISPPSPSPTACRARRARRGRRQNGPPHSSQSPRDARTILPGNDR